MDNRETIVQRIKKKYSTAIEVAIKYYTLLFSLNDIPVTKREIQLVAFTAVRGTLSSGGRKEEFIEMFKSSKATVANMTSKLYELKLMEKIDGKIRVNPAIQLDFNNDILLQLHICCL
jgi:hypothetical protein